MATTSDVFARRSGQHPSAAVHVSQNVSAISSDVFRRGWSTVLFVSMIAYAAVMVTWLATSMNGSEPLGALRVLAPHVLTIVATALAFRAASTQTLDHGARRFWRAVGLSQLLLLLTDVCLLLSHGGTRALSDGAPMLSQMLLLYALIQSPSAPRTATDRSKLVLDVATIIVGGILVVWVDWYSARAHGLLTAPRAFLLPHVAAIGDLLLILIVSVLWRRTGLQHRANVMVLLSVAVLVHFLANVAIVVQMTRGGNTQNWGIVAAPLSTVLIALAAWVKCVTLSQRQMRAHTMTAHAYAGSSLIPFIAVVPGFSLLLVAAFEQTVQPLGGLVIGAAALTSLAFVRQLLSSRETVRALQESTARNNEARFRALVQHSSDVITIVDADSTIRYVSPSVATVLGHDPAKLLNTSLTSLLHPDDVASATAFLADLALAPRTRNVALATAGARSQEWRIAHINGSWMTVDNVGTNLLAEPVIGGLVLNTRDVTEQAVIKHQYMHQAFHDPLTDLANRSLFLYQVGSALARAARPGTPVTVIFLDLDNFKTVNDSLGHAEGDRMLVEAARRLSLCVRESDLIARLGGDEFAVLVEQMDHDGDVLAIADRIRDALAEPFELVGRQVTVSASIGIARNSAQCTTSDLVRNADLAMYVAKTRGKGQYVLFEPSMHEAALERLVVEVDLRRAIEREEFFLEYQPIVVLETGEIIGAEALVRWCCRERGTVPPSVFIPIAEETGLITALGRWVLRRACRTAKQWERDRGTTMRITVNLSGRQLQEPGVVEDVRLALVDSGLDPSHLVLEITESMLMHNTDMSMTRLMALKSLGISLAIDDFGTGYSSLSYLQRYPIDILKIDKAFVDVIDRGGEGPVLASAIVALGETLRLNTVAEGIERESQRAHLIALGCELGQGFLFSKPLDAEEFWTLLQTRGTGSPDAAHRPRDLGAQAA